MPPENIIHRMKWIGLEMVHAFLHRDIVVFVYKNNIPFLKERLLVFS